MTDPCDLSDDVLTGLLSDPQMPPAYLDEVRRRLDSQQARIRELEAERDEARAMEKEQAQQVVNALPALLDAVEALREINDYLHHYWRDDCNQTESCDKCKATAALARFSFDGDA